MLKTPVLRLYIRVETSALREPPPQEHGECQRPPQKGRRELNSTAAAGTAVIIPTGVRALFHIAVCLVPPSPLEPTGRDDCWYWCGPLT